jgi:hypothetical protein
MGIMTLSQATRRVPAAIVLSIFAFSALTVYGTAMALYTADVETGAANATQSLNQYHQALEGWRGLPYQWRLLGIYLVRAGERMSGATPHAVDVVVKSVLLGGSSLVLFAFSRAYVTASGAFCAVALYLVLTFVGFAVEPYSIYFTNDYVMLLCWFGAVYLIRENRFVAAAVLTFVAAWARETMLLVPILLAFRWLRGRSSVGAVVLAGGAWLVPTLLLRQIYPAPVTNWARWSMLFINVPFLQSDVPQLLMTLRYNAKVALFFNVLWVLAALRVWRSSDSFLKDLGAACVVYLLIAYPVIFIRELRHFLPLAILVLPAAIQELERYQAVAGPPLVQSP